MQMLEQGRQEMHILPTITLPVVREEKDEDGGGCFYIETRGSPAYIKTTILFFKQKGFKVTLSIAPAILERTYDPNTTSDTAASVPNLSLIHI